MKEGAKMKLYKKILHVLLICMLWISLTLPQGSSTSIISDVSSKLENSIISSLLNNQKAEASSTLYGGPDWIEVNKNKHRVVLVDDSELKPLILFKAKLDLGWSASDNIAVGNYIYLLTTIPESKAGSGNFFQLPAGVYFYRIPVDFKFQGNLSDAELRADLLEKGAKVVRLQGPAINHSHATYNPSNGTFYIGVGTYVYAVREDDLYRYPNRVETGSRLTAAPVVVGNDLIAVATSTDENGLGTNGDLFTVKGLLTGNPRILLNKLSNHPTAEISTPTGIVALNDLLIPLNYRDSPKIGSVGKFSVYDNGFGAVPTISKGWQTNTNVGVPAPVNYYEGYVYAAAKYGRIYKINASTGQRVWVSAITDVELINNTMTLDGTHLYVPVRRPGKMVKINMATGNQVWEIGAGMQANGSMVDPGIHSGKDIANDPVLWHTTDNREILFYGTTAGQLIFKTVDGYRTDVALDHQTGKVELSSITGSNVSSGQYWETQGTGISTGTVLAKNHLVFGVNTTSTFGEMLFYSVGIADDMYVKSVEGGTYQGKQDVITDVVVGSKDFSSGLRVPIVRLYVDGVLVGEKRIDLLPGEEKTVKFTWQVKDNISDGQITATINIPPEFVETDMDNNTMTTEYSSNFGYNICLPNERNNTAIIKSITHEDSEGNSYVVDYYEYLETIIRDITPDQLRAGYGFEFVTDTEYLDETSTYAGPKKVNAIFPDSPNFVDFNVSKDQTNVTGPPYDEKATWELPLIYVEEYSGNVFHSESDARMDDEDHLVVSEGERKWYTDFYTPDGPYIFKSVASEAGLNDLTSCFTSYVTIKGTPFEDYVRRSVVPDTPFLDDEVGYNWKGKEDIIGALITPYYNPNNNTVTESTYYLSNETVKNIKDEEPQTISKSEVSYFFSSFDFN